MSTQQIDPAIAEFLGKTDKNNKPNENNSQNSQKELDINKKNSYIGDNGEEGVSPDANAVDPEIERYQNLLEKTFGGDVNKALKSYLEAQTALTEKSRELKKYKEPYESVNDILQKNPALFDIMKRASQGENVENLLRGTKEPSGQPLVTNNASELESSVDEKALIQAGLLDASRKDSLTDYEWGNEVMKATQRYMITEYPKKVAAATQAELRKIQEAETTKQQKARESQENNRRWVEGIKNAAVDGWDFNGKHSAYLDELEEEIIGLRDSKNLNLIREDAVELALSRIARRHNVEIDSARPTIQPNLNRVQTQQNINTRQNHQEKPPQSFIEQVIERGMKQNRNRNGDYLQSIKQN